MQAPINQEALQEKWAPLLDYEGLDPIKDSHRRMVTAVLLENQEQSIREEKEFLNEAAPTNSVGNGGYTSSGDANTLGGFDPVPVSYTHLTLPTICSV